MIQNVTKISHPYFSVFLSNKAFWQSSVDRKSTIYNIEIFSTTSRSFSISAIPQTTISISFFRMPFTLTREPYNITLHAPCHLHRSTLLANTSWLAFCLPLIYQPLDTGTWQKNICILYHKKSLNMKNPPAFPNTDGFHRATRPVAYQLLFSHYKAITLQEIEKLSQSRQ